MSTFQDEIAELAQLRDSNGSAWDHIDPESAARMRLQNRFRTGLDIARYTASIMRKDMQSTMRIAASTPSRWAVGTALSASRS